MITDNCQQFGKITRTHGIKGEVILSAGNEINDTILKTELFFLIIDGLPVPFFVSFIRIKSNSSLIVKFDTIDDLIKAETFIGIEVFIPVKKSTRKPKEVEENDNEFIGYLVIDKSLGSLGTIADIIKFPGNSLLQVMKNKREILIPIHEDIILNIDDKNKTITVNCPDGLIDL